MGYLDDEPEKGTIVFQGKRIDGLETEDIVRLGIAYVPEGREVFPELTLRENLLMGAYHGHTIAGSRKIWTECSRYFPVLKDRLKQQAGTLSGGEQQMLAIGRALMSRPKLMILDEPSLGLSPLLVSEIFEIIRSIGQGGDHDSSCRTKRDQGPERGESRVHYGNRKDRARRTARKTHERRGCPRVSISG